jgi:hypothetical protein
VFSVGLAVRQKCRTAFLLKSLLMIPDLFISFVFRWQSRKEAVVLSVIRWQSRKEAVVLSVVRWQSRKEAVVLSVVRFFAL